MVRHLFLKYLPLEPEIKPQINIKQPDDDESKQEEELNNNDDDDGQSKLQNYLNFLEILLENCE
jgi:hypothetical protein